MVLQIVQQYLNSVAFCKVSKCLYIMKLTVGLQGIYLLSLLSLVYLKLCETVVYDIEIFVYRIDVMPDNNFLMSDNVFAGKQEWRHTANRECLFNFVRCLMMYNRLELRYEQGLFIHETHYELSITVLVEI